MLTAYFECDSLNNVLLKTVAEQKSKRVASDVGFKDGRLNYKATTDRDTVYLPSDTIYFDKEVPVPVEIEKEVNVLTKWQAIRIWIGNIVLIILFALAGWKVFKLYLKLKK
ncbi:MAG TPA: hypothetical protein DDW85_00675 [Porphyromonadaceae bacterium]|nr:hypothetical protein [Porphyromonadaceae bacterium]